MQQIKPRALRKGDTIAIVVPASPVKRDRINRGIQRLEAEGFCIKRFGDIYREHGYLAGDDTTRAAELMAAFADPKVAAVFPARGGTGVTRLLDLLDYDVIRKNPKIFVGFSDMTALHSALHNKTGLVTFHGPHPSDGIGAPDGLSELSARTYWQALLADQYNGTKSTGYAVPLAEEDRASIVTRVPGKARGRLIGGNLALIGAVLGTPYEIDAKESILLLEDIHEPPYRVDRLLAQLKLSGKLTELAAVVLGQFTDCDPQQGEASLTLDEIFHHYFDDLGIPVMENFPTGHCRDNVTLPLNVEVELDSDQQQLTVLEHPTDLGDPA